MDLKKYESLIWKLRKEPRWINYYDWFNLVNDIEKKQPEIIIESWRARWYSTEILATCFPNIKIISIDFEKNKDTKISEEKLSKYNNIEIVYWDSRKIIDNYLTNNKSYIFIDWPKWHEAILLTSKIFNNENVLSIALDDFPVESFYTNIIENIYWKVIKSYELEKSEDCRMIFLDKSVSKLSNEVLNIYIKWFDNIRPFYTKYTYKINFQPLKKILNIFKK